jgi:copper chaperone CopZ
LEDTVNENSSFNQGLTQTATFEAQGDTDADNVESRLSSVEGVRDVEVNGKTITVTYDPTQVDENLIRTAVENDGVTPLAGGGTEGNNANLTPFSYSETNPQ